MVGKCPSKHPRVSDPMVDLPSDLEFMANRTQFLIDQNYVKQKWQSLERATDSIINIDQRDADADYVFQLNPLLDQFSGISVVSPYSVTALYTGGIVFGHISLYSEIDGKRHCLFDALKVENSVDAFIESLYIAFHLRTKYAFWHGLYGRDYTLLLYNSMNNLSQNCEPFRRDIFDINNVNLEIDRPLGIRVSRRNNKFYVSCLAIYAVASIVDKTIQIENGKLIVIHDPDTVYNSPVARIY